MTNNNKISDEKFWYDINRETAKILALLSGKIDNTNVSGLKKYYLLVVFLQPWNIYILLYSNNTTS